jgi:hypothetical protein
MAITIWVLFLILTGIAAIDAYCEYRRWPLIGDRVAAWSERDPWPALGVITAVFVLVAHFVLNPLDPTK